jgi:hypothetical protein
LRARNKEKKMPIAGKGMLLTSMDIDPADEVDFNRWYDREHIEERVAIDGFLEARRYVAHAASPKYLSLYSTATFDVLDSPAYREKLKHQTEWSNRVMARFKNMIRSVARITYSRGNGRGAALGIIRLRPSSDTAEKTRATLGEKLDPARRDGIISMHLLESDPQLSKAIGSDTPGPGAGDWFVLIDGTDMAAVSAAVAALKDVGPQVSSGTYRLMWDLAKSDVPRS